jgi:hypothetical protein
MGTDFDLNNYEPTAAVLTIQQTKTQALVDVGRKELRKVTVPHNTKLTLHLIIIKYLSSVNFRSFSRGYKLAICSDIESFLDFINNPKYSDDSDIPNDVLHEHIQYLRESTNKKSNSMAASLFNTIRPMEWFAEQDDDESNSEYKEILRVYIANAPRIPRSETNPTPPLSKLFKDCPFNDTEIIKSLRLVCCWTLLQYSEQRKTLLKNDGVNDVAIQLKQGDVWLPPLSHATFGKEMKDTAPDCLRQYEPLLKAVLESGDPVLQERLMQSIPHPFDLVMTQKEMELVLKKVCPGDGHLRKEYIYIGKKYQLSTIKTLSYRDLLAPSITEAFVAHCFFASDRVQRSNLSRLKLEDIVNNERGIQSQHVKVRRPTKKRKNVTPLYPPHQLVHESITRYIDAVSGYQEMLHDGKSEGVFPSFSHQDLRGWIGQSTNSLYHFFNLMITEGTFTHKQLMEDVTEQDAKPFLWIANKIICNNQVVKKENSEYNKLRRKDKTIERGQLVKTPEIGLSPAFIGASRVAMESGNATKIKGSKDVLPNADTTISSALTSHSKETKYNIYNDRTHSKETIESRRTFATQMGNLMVEDAKKMGQMMESVEVINFKEAKKLLGCSSQQDDYKGLIDERDMELGLTGEILDANKKIFIANDLTAALIILRISHLDQQLPLLLNDEPDTRNKAVDAALEKIYYKEILKRYPEHIVSAGKALSNQLDFSFAELI